MKKIITLFTALFIGGIVMAQSKSAVIYFSATGITRSVAQKIAGITGSDLIEIKPEQPYTSQDLNWNDNNSRTTKECNALETIRPAMKVKIDISGYDTIYLGYPIWWSQAPNIVYTFVESADFSGKTVYPFCTSGGSSIGTSATNLAKKTPGAVWKSGKRFGRNVSENEVKNWR